MATRKEDQVQRGHYFAIVDEVDSILIDEARTPLIISGPSVHTFDEQYDAMEADGRVARPRAGAVVRPLSVRGRGVDEEIASGRRLQRARRRGAGTAKSACCCSASKPASRRSEGLLKMLENPENLRLMNQAELELHADQKQEGPLRGEGGIALRHGRKKPRSRPDRKRPQFHQPEGPGRLRAAGFDDVSCTTLTPARKPTRANAWRPRPRCRRISRPRRRKSTPSRNCSRPTAFTSWTWNTSSQDDKVIIVDEHTGRPMTGRRWSDGLHQAVEAKEGVEIERETQTLATITIQNYFRLYKKLAGMTGTAETEAARISRHLQARRAWSIPTNKPNIRKDAQRFGL